LTHWSLSTEYRTTIRKRKSHSLSNSPLRSSGKQLYRSSRQVCFLASLLFADLISCSHQTLALGVIVYALKPSSQLMNHVALVRGPCSPMVFFLQLGVTMLVHLLYTLATKRTREGFPYKMYIQGFLGLGMWSYTQV